MALRQRSTHLPAAGDPNRQAAANRLFAILNGAPEYHAAVARLKELDELRESDWSMCSIGSYLRCAASSHDIVYALLATVPLTSA